MFGIANNTEFLTAIGIANVPEETKAKLVAGLEELATKNLIIKLSDRLTEEQAEEFGTINDEQEAKAWLAKNIPDFQNILEDTLSEMRDDILANKAEVVG